MTDYQKTKIYKIESNQGDKVYVGSTAKEYLSQRFQQHKHAYKRWQQGKCGKVMSYELFEEYGPENCQIVLIESYPCNSKDEKNSREGHYIKELNCVNKNIIGRSPKESLKAYLESDKGKQGKEAYLKSDRRKEAVKAYRESEKGKETLKAYRESDKEKETKKAYFKSDKGKEALKAYRESEKGKEKFKEAAKKYNQANKEKIAQKSKEYYIENKEKIIERERKRYQEKKVMKAENEI